MRSRRKRNMERKRAAMPLDCSSECLARSTFYDPTEFWRRTGTYGSFLYPVANGKEIAEGKARPDTLGVRAIDDLTLHVTLTTPAAHFLQCHLRPGRNSAPRRSKERILMDRCR